MWIPYLASSSSVYFLGSGGGTAARHVNNYHIGMGGIVCPRRFLFHTTLASGAEPGFPPFAPDAAFATSPLPLFATNLGRLMVGVPIGDAVEPLTEGAFSIGLGCVAGAETLVVRKVLLTLIALKDAGFFTVEEVRT